MTILRIGVWEWCPCLLQSCTNLHKEKRCGQPNQKSKYSNEKEDSDNEDAAEAQAPESHIPEQKIIEPEPEQVPVVAEEESAPATTTAVPAKKIVKKVVKK